MATSANSFPELRPPTRFLLGPGPSNVHPRVMKAMLSPVLGHLDPDFVGIMEDIKKLLRLVFRTSNEITFPVSGTGSAGMECVMANLIEEGDEVVVGVNGAFGGRLAEVAHRMGAKVHKVEARMGPDRRARPSRASAVENPPAEAGRDRSRGDFDRHPSAARRDLEDDAAQRRAAGDRCGHLARMRAARNRSTGASTRATAARRRASARRRDSRR